MPRELLRRPLSEQHLDGIITLLALDVLRGGTRLRGKGVATLSTIANSVALLWLSEEGPTPPLMKIDDDVEGVEGEGMLTLKSMRWGRS